MANAPAEWGEGTNPLPQITPREEEKELMSLTPHEVADIEADILGLTTQFEHTNIDDRTTEASLSEVDDELAKIPDASKSAFSEAQRKAFRLVSDEHKKAFLWREDFDPKRAAQRLVRYWEHRRKLFGPDKCYLPLTLKGALRDDIVALTQGFCRILPIKDLSGRVIIFIDPSVHDVSKYSLESLVRALWYILEVSCEKEEDMRQGIILLVFPRNISFEKIDFALYSSFFQLEISYLPVRMRSVHFCHPARFFHMVVPVLKYCIGKRLRERLVVHYGSDEEVLQKLCTLKIPPDRVPSDMGGEVILENMEQWLYGRLQQEGENFHVYSGAGVSQTSSQAFTSVCEANESIPQSNAVSHMAQVSSSPRDILSQKIGEVEDERSLKRVRDRHWRQDERKTHGNKHRSTDWLDSNKEISIDGSYVGNARSLVKDVEGAAVAEKTGVISNEMSMSKANGGNEGLTFSARFSPYANQVITPELQKLLEESPSGLARLVDESEQNNSFVTPSVPGCKGDSRMNKAVEEKMQNPKLTLVEALKKGGFVFPDHGKPGMTDLKVFDSDNVSLHQRKNQLYRRMRKAKQRLEKRKTDSALSARAISDDDGVSAGEKSTKQAV